MSNATILSPSLRPRRSASNRSLSRQSNVGQPSQRQDELEVVRDTPSPCVGLVGEEDTTFIHHSDEGSFLPGSSVSPPPPAVRRAISVSSSHGDSGAGGRDSLSAAHQPLPGSSMDSHPYSAVGGASATESHSSTICRLQEQMSSIQALMAEVHSILVDFSRPMEERSWYHRYWADLSEQETRVHGVLLQLLPRRDPYLDQYATMVREHWAQQTSDGSKR
jgi:hypothetical protein